MDAVTSPTAATARAMAGRDGASVAFQVSLK